MSRRKPETQDALRACGGYTKGLCALRPSDLQAYTSRVYSRKASDDVDTRELAHWSVCDCMSIGTFLGLSVTAFQACTMRRNTKQEPSLRAPDCAHRYSQFNPMQLLLPINVSPAACRSSPPPPSPEAQKLSSRFLFATCAAVSLMTNPIRWTPATMTSVLRIRLTRT